MNKIWITAALGAAALLTLTGESSAQYRGGRGGVSIGIGSGGYGYGNGYGYGSGYGRGYGGYPGYGYGKGYGGSGISIGIGSGGYGYGSGYGLGNSYYGSSYNSGYYSQPAYGSAYYAQPAYSSGYYSQPAYGTASPYAQVYTSQPSVTTTMAGYYAPTTAGATAASTTQEPNSAMLEVRVPANAEVWFGNSKTEQTGAVRYFASPSLEPGATYTYDVKARWTGADGQPVERAKTARIQAGARVAVDFNTP